MKLVWKIRRVFEASPDINPKEIMSKWFGGTPISDDELKELEEFTRREGYTEHMWVLFQCIERGIKPYDNVYVWNADLFKYGHWVEVKTNA